MKIFHYQYNTNPIYQQYVNFVLDPAKISDVHHYTQIPFLPVEFFKTHKVLCNGCREEKVFTSSGTTGSEPSRHYIADLDLYESSFHRCFERFFGRPEQYTILALLPGYLEREGSSLIYMADKLIAKSQHPASGFYLGQFENLAEILGMEKGKHLILFGVSFVLLELAEKYPQDLSGSIIMETGGMKGRRTEMVREELHQILCSGFSVRQIYSEYGMTELLSQAYSKGQGIFHTPPWMKILIRDTNDPKTLLATDQTGGINVIDLANIYSCSFIATQDLGKLHKNGSFEVLGRFDSSDIRGCNLLVT